MNSNHVHRVARTVLLVAACASVHAGAAGQTIRTVRAAGPGGAPPWDTATPDVRAAIMASEDGDEVWIAEGTYASDQTILIPRGVKIYGGFIGTEGHPDKRSADAFAHTTIIDGVSVSAASHVTMITVGAMQWTLLDRLHVRDSRTFPGSGEQDTIGASGLLIVDGSPLVRDCVFENHIGNFHSRANAGVLGLPGGAVGIERASPTFVNCRFRRNTAGMSFSNGGCSGGVDLSTGIPGASGGAVAARAASPTFIDCVFESNRASDGISGIGCQMSSGAGGAGGGGGAFFGENCRAVFRSCTFSANHAGSGGRGGGTFMGAAANGDGGAGGAILVIGGVLTLENCVCSDNRAGDGGEQLQPANGVGRAGGHGGRGGALAILGTASCFVANCVLVSNHGGNGGDGGSPANCPLTSLGGDSGTGGALYSQGALTIVSSTLVDCAAGSSGASFGVGPNCTLPPACCTQAPTGLPGVGAIASTGTTSVSNCIVWNSSTTPLSGAMDVSYSLVPAGTPGAGNINQDPMFVNAAARDFRLALVSPCIDAGSNPALAAAAPGLTTDIANSVRYAEAASVLDTGVGMAPIVDIGAYEYRCAGDFNGSGVASIQDVLDFLDAWFQGRLQADVNLSNTVTIADVFEFLSAWFAGCA